jgi:hypothetical protein
MPRFTVRVDRPEDVVTLERYARVARVPISALMREVTLDYGPVWMANRAAERVMGEEPKRVRARNGSRS